VRITITITVDGEPSEVPAGSFTFYTLNTFDVSSGATASITSAISYSGTTRIDALAAASTITMNNAAATVIKLAELNFYGVGAAGVGDASGETDETG